MKFELLRVRIGSWVIRCNQPNLVCYYGKWPNDFWVLDIADAQVYNRLSDAEAALAKVVNFEAVVDTKKPSVA